MTKHSRQSVTSSLVRIVLSLGFAFQTFFPTDMPFALASGYPEHLSAAGPVLSVNAADVRHTISPEIYGLNFAKETFADEIQLPLRRWGGNSTSRYNWQTGNTNTGMDWFYENVAQYNPITSLKETHTQWVDQNLRTSTDSLLTIPTIGFVASDDKSCSFSIAKYGNQQSADSAWRPDCGNGIKTDGQKISGNNPADSSLAVDANFMKSWVQGLVGNYGLASANGVKYYALDNEPDLWGDTHRDVHPNPQDYDELISKSLSYAAAIKTADPSAKVLGFSSFGWTGYWYSELDTVTAAENGYTYFPDYQTHGNKYQIQWYLEQMRQYEQSTGKRLLDYLDLHYYPASGVALRTAGDAARQALRLRSTRSLWDPTYTDESWIGGADQPVDWRTVRLIPRMRAWAQSYYPATKLAITEYNFGGLEHINGALTQADILGIFGREGLDLATLWNYPNSSDGLGYQHFETLPGAYAFRMFRNFDGQGGQFGDVSIGANSVDQGKLAIYAARRSKDGALTLMIINKSGESLLSEVKLSNYQPAALAKVYLYSAANLAGIVQKPDQAVSKDGFAANFPAFSITLMVLSQYTGPNPGSCSLFPANNIWNARIDNLPVHARSSQWVDSIGRNTGFHMDFGSGTWAGGPIGIPYNVVDGSVEKVPVGFYYPGESDPGPYPIPDNPAIEYGSDHHILIVDSSTCKLYEIYDASYGGRRWSAGSGAVWDLNSNQLRPDTWTSADAAGLPILPGLVRYEEILAGKIEHAIRFTASQTNRYIWPARHQTSNDPDALYIPPMGARFRLKASFDISGYSMQMQVILRAMKTYGIILADNGSNWYVSGAPDSRWNNDMLHTLDDLTGNDFEAVDTSVLMKNPDSGEVKPASVIISGNSGAAGVSIHYVNGTARSVLSDSNGNYRIVVPSGWSGTLTPSKVGVVFFSPSKRTYTSIDLNQTGQNFRANRQMNFISVSSQDGYLREVNETSGLAGLRNAISSFLLVGDDNLNRQYRAILSFNTTNLPENAVILSARLKLKKQSGSGADPMGTHGSMMFDIRKTFFGVNSALGLDDFNAAASLNSAGRLGKTDSNGVYSGSFGASAFQYINRIGLTQIRLRFQLDDDNDRVADWLSFFSAEALASPDRPMLSVIYYLP